jgi:ubiquinone/menaquinone biosynthesis C-methylase UbiE
MRYDAVDWTCPACGAHPCTSHGILQFIGADTGLARADDAEYLVSELADAEQWHFWFQARRRIVTWALREYFPGMRSLLDVGCGTGFTLESLGHDRPDVALSGSDVRMDALAVAHHRVPAACFFQALVERLPFSEEFDVLTALDVIEHIDRDEEALAGMFRATRPGGGVLVMVPQHQWLWSAVDDFSHHRRRYTRTDLMMKVRAAGFEILRCTSCFMATLPLLVASRWRPRSGAFDPAAELRIPRLINALLIVLLECERWLITLGVPLRAGGSLLLVARRPPA